MKQKKIILTTIMFLLISIINLNAEDYKQSNSFKQLVKEINDEKYDTLFRAEQQLEKDKEPNRLMLTFSSGYLIPFWQSVNRPYHNGYGGSIQLKISNIYELMGFMHNLGVEGEYYLNSGNSRADLTTYIANFIIDANVNNRTKAIFGYEIGAGVCYQELKEQYNSISSTYDFDVKGMIKLGYKFSDNVYFIMKFGGISILDDFETGNTQEFLKSNLDISYIF
ncbi:MAG: hypothetical protein U9R41_08235 [Candidatus Marinimicrobia bacterium]|nr:hypothetical protein [Candidatus Neomarinimicrobiota bacterium]